MLSVWPFVVVHLARCEKKKKKKPSGCVDSMFLHVVSLRLLFILTPATSEMMQNVGCGWKSLSALPASLAGNQPESN